MSALVILEGMGACSGGSGVLRSVLFIVLVC